MPPGRPLFPLPRPPYVTTGASGLIKLYHLGSGIPRVFVIRLMMRSEFEANAVEDGIID